MMMMIQTESKRVEINILYNNTVYINQ